MPSIAYVGALFIRTLMLVSAELVGFGIEIPESPVRQLRNVCSRRRAFEIRSRAKVRTPTGNNRRREGATSSTRRQPWRLRIADFGVANAS